MNKLTIKTGCVEAVFKRGRERTKGVERPLLFKAEHPTPTSETLLHDAGPETFLPTMQSQDEGMPAGPMATK